MANPRVQAPGRGEWGWGNERATNSEENNGWRLFSVNYVPGTVLRACHVLIRLILSSTQERVALRSPFTDEETEAHQVSEPGFGPRRLAPGPALSPKSSGSPKPQACMPTWALTSHRGKAEHAPWGAHRQAGAPGVQMEVVGTGGMHGVGGGQSRPGLWGGGAWMRPGGM